MCEKYRSNIEEILKKSDLSTITTKKIRRTVEEQTGTSLEPIKKEMNHFIEEIFVKFQQQKIKDEEPVVKREDLVVKKEAPVKKTAIKKTTKATIKKTVTKKKKEPKERKPADWPVFKVSPPLSIIANTDLCTRPQAVKKMWEYIRKHGLQSEKDKRVIICDANFKELCDGAEEINAFTINKYTQKCFESIPKEEQAKYKEIVAEREKQLLEENTN